MTPKDFAIEIYEKHYNCDFLNDNDSGIKHAIETIKIMLDEYWIHNTERRDFLKETLKELKKL